MPTTTFQFLRYADGLVAAEALAHVHHTAFALAETALELLALRGKGFEEGRCEAFDGGVPVQEDAVAVLEALG